MSRDSGGWTGLLRSLGQTALGLVRSELAAVREELGESKDRLVKALVILLVSAFFLFWAVGALVFLALEVLSLWWPRWGAALAVFVALALLVAILAIWGRSRLRRLENPVQTVQRRIGDHLDWWQDRVLESPDEEEQW